LKVTGVLPQKNEIANNIYIDGEYSFSASYEDIIKYSIKEGMEINNDDLASLIALCEYSKAYNYSLKLLSIRDYTSEEIRKKLKQRSFSDATIVEVTRKLAEYNFINDDNYAEKYKNDCLKIKKYGINKIKNNLVMKGIARDTVDNIEINEDEQYELCKEAAIKKEKILGDCKNRREKMFRFLISRGFEYDMAIKVIKNVLNDTKDIEKIE
jgi:regulatory protein